MCHKSTKFLIWILLGKFGATFLPQISCAIKARLAGPIFLVLSPAGFCFLAPREREEALLDLAKATSVLVKESKRRIHYRRQPTRSRRHLVLQPQFPDGLLHDIIIGLPGLIRPLALVASTMVGSKSELVAVSALLRTLFLHSSRARAKLPGGLSTLSPRSAPTHQDSTFFHEPSRAPFLASEGSFDAASTHLPSATHPATENPTYRALYLFKCETLPNVLLWKTCFYGASLCYTKL